MAATTSTLDSEAPRPTKSAIKSVITKPYRVLCVSDSRGKGLDKHFEENFEKNHPGITIIPHFLVYSGATLEAITAKIIQFDHNTQYNLILINAGICSFTSKASYNGLRCIDYAERSNKVSLAVDTLEDLNSRFGKRCNLCTIPPASLSKNFRFRNPGAQIPLELAPQQKALLEDLHTINQKIIERNQQNESSSIDLAKQLFTSSLKRKRGGKRVVKFSDKNLADGIHANDDLKTTWFNLITKFVKSRIDAFTVENTIESEDEESLNLNSTLDSSDTELTTACTSFSTEESEPDTGNFKRRKN